MSKYLIIGNGIAGTTAAEHIRRHDDSGEITILTEERIPLYSRIRLIEYLAREITEEDLIIRKEGWFKDRNISIKLGTRVTDAVPGERTVITDDGSRLTYDKLLVATGSHSFVPPIKGADKNGVFSLRSVKDADDILAAAEGIEDVLLIGGGLLGLEAGNSIRKLGKKVTVVEFFPRLLPRQLDVQGAGRLQGVMEEMGFSFRLGATTEEITGEEKVSGAILKGGETIETEMVIISAGVRPNMELAGLLDLESDKAVKVDAQMRTNQPDIYAAGDVVEFDGVFYGIWPAAMEQGRIAGASMAGEEAAYQGSVMSNTLKVVGIDLASAGNIDAEDEFDCRTMTKGNVYKKIVLDNDRIIGCIMLGDTKGFNAVTRAMSDEKDVSGVKDRILSEGFDFASL